MEMEKRSREEEILGLMSTVVDMLRKRKEFELIEYIYIIVSSKVISYIR